ncbi:MAG: DoxX family membrane protein [Bacteroidetes bacterium]|nr:DoxX family membrane protein [Bacteroidota bacterium]
MNTTTYLILRLSIGMSCFGHGLVRVPKLPVFSNWMTTQFQKSFLPQALVLPFSYALPIVELVLGVMLLLGLFTKFAAIAASIVMIILIFGTTTIEDWSALPSQLIHVAFLAMLVQFLSSNTWCVDNLLQK